MEPKRVLIGGLTSNCGGLESYVMSIYRRIDREQLQFDFLNYYARDLAFEDEIKRLGGRVFRVPMKRESIREHYRFLNHIFCSAQYIGVYLQCNRKLESLDTVRLAKKYGVKHRVIHSHNSTQQTVPFIQNIRIMITEKTMDHYITDYFACSDEAGKWMFGDRNYTVIKNSVDTKLFRYDELRRNAIREKYGIDDMFVLGSVGRLEYQKNPEYLVEIFKDVHARNPRTAFLHLGNGPQKEDINNQLKKYGLEDCFFLLGNQDNVSDYMNAMDAFLLPSRYEGFPIVLVEAQATGLPCFVADNITLSCNLSGNMKFLPIDGVNESWSKEILSSKTNDRSAGVEIIKKAGYDIYDLTNQIQDYFLN